MPILVGPKAKIAATADKAGLSVDGIELIDVPHSHAAADKAVELVRAGQAELLMKGSLHTDELMAAVVAKETGLRTARRISHVFVMDVPTYDKPLFITDAAINIFPTLEDKVHITQNAIDLFRGLGLGTPKVAILSAVETVNAKIPGTIDAAALCKMADRGQITGGELDGPLALDNAISPKAAAIKGIASPVAGQADILIVPDLEAGNMLAKNLSFMANADAAGVVLGARVPIILTSRADSVRARLASCAVAALYAHARSSCSSRIARRMTRPRRQCRQLEHQVPALRGRRPGRPRASGQRADRRHRHPPAAGGRRRGRPACRRRDLRRRRPPRPAERTGSPCCLAPPAARRRDASGGRAPRRAWRPEPRGTCPRRRRGSGRRSTRSCRWPRCTSRTTSRRSACCASGSPICRRSPASIPPSTAAIPSWPTASRCPRRSTTRACAATAFTACPTNTSPAGCPRSHPGWRRRELSWPISAPAPRPAPSSPAAASTAPWGSPPSTACPWAPGRASSIPASCST